MKLSEVPPQPPMGLSRIPIHAILPSPYQARRLFDEDSLLALAESMKQEGLIQPITVRPVVQRISEAAADPLNEVDIVISPPVSLAIPPLYELVSGERRLRAAKLLGWKTIEARVITVISEGEAAAKGLIENLQRADLNPVEEAEGFALLNRVDPSYWTQERIASVAGKSRSYVTQSMSLLDLPSSIQEDIRRGTYSRGHGLELARLPTRELQLAVAQEIPGKLTRERTRHKVDAILHRRSSGNDALVPADQDFSANDPLADFWQDFVKNPWLATPGEVKVRYLGQLRWSFEIPGAARETLGLAAPEKREQLKHDLGKILVRLGRSLSADGRPTRPPSSNLPSSESIMNE